MEESKPKTTFENKCSILSEFWLGYRTDPEFEKFSSYNDIGLPLAFLVSEALVKAEPLAKGMVEETFDLLLAALEREDSGFESLDDVFVG